MRYYRIGYIVDLALLLLLLLYGLYDGEKFQVYLFIYSVLSLIQATSSKDKRSEKSGPRIEVSNLLAAVRRQWQKLFKLY